VIEDDKATDVRITFRTHKSRVEKLKRVAEVHELKVGARYSVGAAINHVVDHYRDERPKKKKKAVKRKKS
jgi:hypothetical protein